LIIALQITGGFGDPGLKLFVRLIFVPGYAMYGVVISVYKICRRLIKQLSTNTRRHLSNDHRPPLLYLRSFNTEEEIGKLSLDGRTDEEVIVKALWEVGPVVAVGRPWEEWPNTGALRLYFADDEWQDKVKALMSISKLIVVQAGHSDGLKWELSEILRNISPDKFIVSCYSLQQLSQVNMEVDYDLFVNNLTLQMKDIGLEDRITLPTNVEGVYFLYFGSTAICG